MDVFKLKKSNYLLLLLRIYDELGCRIILEKNTEGTPTSLSVFFVLANEINFFEDQTHRQSTIIELRIS